jgi:hypothetical protein
MLKDLVTFNFEYFYAGYLCDENPEKHDTRLLQAPH